MSFLWIVQTVLVLAVFIHLTRDICFTLKQTKLVSFLSYHQEAATELLRHVDQKTEPYLYIVLHLKHGSAINA